MNDIYIGKIVSTHGIKGEIKLLSDFPYKEKAFHVGSEILIDYKPYQIKSYRKHKNYDMITLEGYSDINDVLFLMKKKVYKQREDLHLAEDEVLDSDLVSYKIVTTTGEVGHIKEIFMASPTNKILRIELLGREVLVPFSSPFVTKIDKKFQTITISLVEGM